jgi:hypothetical protein
VDKMGLEFGSLLKRVVENKYLEQANKIFSGETSTNDGIQQGLNILKAINRLQQND